MSHIFTYDNEYHWNMKIYVCSAYMYVWQIYLDIYTCGYYIFI